MVETKQEQSKAALSLMARPIYWLAVGPTTVVSLLAFIVSWPLGPGFVDEGAITKLRLAIALIAFALFFSVAIIAALLLLILARLNRLSQRLNTDMRVTGGSSRDQGDAS